MTELRKDLPTPIPENILALPRDDRGYPVPFFVAWPNGKPDFRCTSAEAISAALGQQLCWVCGKKRYKKACFVIGPMCAVNRVSSEPPSHEACAHWAARACPFLARPKAIRREAGLDKLPTSLPPGEMIDRNPGVALCWTSSHWKPFKTDQGGLLFDVGDPISVAWYAQGRTATQAEVVESITSGLPILQQMANEEGEASRKELNRRLEQALKLVPAT